MLETTGSGSPEEPKGPIAVSDWEGKVWDTGATGPLRVCQDSSRESASSHTPKNTETWKCAKPEELEPRCRSKVNTHRKKQTVPKSLFTFCVHIILYLYDL